MAVNCVLSTVNSRMTHQLLSRKRKLADVEFYVFAGPENKRQTDFADAEDNENDDDDDDNNWEEPLARRDLACNKSEAIDWHYKMSFSGTGA